MLALVIVTIAVIVIFDYTNGFHDASNIVATVIASRAMSPVKAVCLVAVFEFLGPLLAGTAVADTIGGFVHLEGIAVEGALVIVLCGILGAVAWNLFTWRFGVPSSSSHALVGGLAGAVIISIGADHVVWGIAALGHGRLTGPVQGDYREATGGLVPLELWSVATGDLTTRTRPVVPAMAGTTGRGRKWALGGLAR